MAIPVSSSIVTNRTSFAEPGRCLTTPRDLDIPTIADAGEVAAPRDAHSIQLFTKEAHRMSAQRKLGRPIVFGKLAASGQRAQSHVRFDPFCADRALAGICCSEQRQWRFA
ncbi:hypothetical protein HNP60_002686 [Sphingobium sp. B1D3A]|uniref:Uncharacterized protein n=1 Tax=Sphingobium lignivorans TaxID=2735886 RepID=A0ABR6NHF1_9SPHN|nr:hypothetical protein [Sphingobium lignivorans]